MTPSERLIWVTNNQEAARQLRTADAAYEAAMALCRDFKLGQKVAAIREARAARDEAYNRIISAA